MAMIKEYAFPANRPQAKTTVAPLDRVKILFQTSSPHFAKYTGSSFGFVTALSDILRNDGVAGLFRGHSATLLRIFPYASIKFVAYEQFRAILIPNRQHETALRRLISGSAAGVTTVFLTYPLEVIRVRLAFETKREGHSTLREICRKIYHELPPVPAPAKTSASSPAAVLAATEAMIPRSGIANFYRGFSATLLGMLPYAGVSFLTHDTVGDLLRAPAIAAHTTLPVPPNHPEGKAVPLKTWAQFLAGGLAGVVSQTSAYPLEIIRRRMQVGGTVGDGRRLRMGETARLIWKERGFRGYWTGLGIGYVKIVPMVAVSFWVYERGKTYMGV